MIPPGPERAIVEHLKRTSSMLGWCWIPFKFEGLAPHPQRLYAPSDNVDSDSFGCQVCAHLERDRQLLPLVSFLAL